MLLLAMPPLPAEGGEGPRQLWEAHLGNPASSLEFPSFSLPAAFQNLLIPPSSQPASGDQTMLRNQIRHQKAELGHRQGKATESSAWGKTPSKEEPQSFCT